VHKPNSLVSPSPALARARALLYIRDGGRSGLTGGKLGEAEEFSGAMTLGMAAEAVKGAVREVWTSKGVPPMRRVAILITLLLIIVRELVGTAMMAGYGTYAFWVYSSLRAWRKDGEVEEKDAKAKAKGKAKAKSESNVVIARNVQYGQTRRNL
jgi:hypothetical protein